MKMLAKYLNVDTFLTRVAGICNYARMNGWVYDDSHSVPPCADGKISCDRLPSRALWDLGFYDGQTTDTSQSCGVVVSRLGAWLEDHGFVKETSYKKAKRGSICIVKNDKGQLHTFIINKVEGTEMERYDCGSNNCIQSSQPIRTQLNLYPNLVALYNFPELNKTVRKKGTVYNCNHLFVRKWAGRTYSTLDSQPSIDCGDEVGILDEIYTKEGVRWYYILTDKNKHGFVNAGYIMTD